LSPAQQSLIASLQGEAAGPIKMNVWPIAGTVSHLELDAPSGAASNAPEQAARAFVTKYAGLWKLTSLDQLGTDSVQVGQNCTTVSFHLIDAKLPVYNASLSVGVGAEGHVRMVSARISGDVPSVEPGAGKITADAAKALLLARFKSDRVGLPDPTQVIIDPYFLGNARHRPARAWLFKAPEETTAPSVRSVAATGSGGQPGVPGTGSDAGHAGPFAVDADTGQVVVSGPTVTGTAVNPGSSGCPGGTASALPRVVVDPMTGSPSYVGLTDVAGLSLSGSTDAARALSLFSTPLIVSMYGDLAPAQHLLMPVIRHRSDGGTAVTFRQFEQQVPVEGAAVTVNLDASGAPQSIIGRLIFRPKTSLKVSINAADATRAAAHAYIPLECRNNRKCVQSLGRSPMPSGTPTLVILSNRLLWNTKIASGHERLTWKIPFKRRVVYWAANGQPGLLFSYTTIQGHIPVEVFDGRQGFSKVFSNLPTGTGHTFGTIDPDSSAVVSFLPIINSFYASLGRAHSFDNNDLSTLCVVTRDPNEDVFENAYFGPTQEPIACSGGAGLGLTFGPKMTVNDVVAHEFTHAVTASTAALIYDDESGALNESYSDIMSELIFPDQTPQTPNNTWLQGEGAPGGPFRDMKNPLMHDQPDNMGSERTMCNTDWKFTHQCDSISNLAAVRISDGAIPGNAAAGIGPTKLKILYYSTLTGGNPPASPALTGLVPSSRFLDQRVTTVENCWVLVAMGALPDGTTFTPDDCLHVQDSFDSVGLTVDTHFGWFQFSLGATNGLNTTETMFSGQKLFNGCTIKDVTIRGVDGDGSSQDSNIADGMEVDMLGWTAKVISTEPPADPTDRAVTFTVQSGWNHTGTVYILESYNKPTGITADEQCLNPMPAATAPPTHSRTLFGATMVGHWASFLNGESITQAYNPGLSMPAGCTIDMVSGVRYENGNAVLPPLASWAEGGTDYSVDRPASVTALPGRLDLSVHTWHDGASGIFVRPVYNIQEPDGTDCSVAGATQNTD
jgi:Zn-dependent metalloprotease